jgi:predicted DNA-binding protein
MQSSSESTNGGVVSVPKELLDKISIYVPKNKLQHRLVERLLKLAEAKDRSVNYLVVEAIIEYLEKEEKS